jgi:UDP-glucose 4-epimerase
VRVLITGVAGFVGSNLALRLLAEGFKVAGIDNLAYGVREQVPDGVEFHGADIRSREIYGLFKGVRHVFHLAAKNCIADCQNDPVETAEINVAGTINVFEAARRGGVEKVTYAESSALYEGCRTFPTPESDIRPESFYAASKAASAHFAGAYSRFHGIKFTALRYFCVYGPRQDYRRTIPPVMSAFIMRLLKGEPPVIYGSGEKRRDFVYVDDVNDFHMRCIRERATDGRVFNIGSGVNHSVNEVYGMVSKVLGVSIPPVHRDALEGEAEHTLADITEAERLGWRPRTGIMDGLRLSAQYIRDNVMGRIR